MVWRYPALNTKCRHFLNNIQLWLNYIELMIWLSTQRIYIPDNTTILDICRLSHSSCFVYYSLELLPSRKPSTNRKMIENDRTFSRFALSFYSLLHFCGHSEQSRYYMSMGVPQTFWSDILKHASQRTKNVVCGGCSCNEKVKRLCANVRQVF